MIIDMENIDPETQSRIDKNMAWAKQDRLVFASRHEMVENALLEGQDKALAAATDVERNLIMASVESLQCELAAIEHVASELGANIEQLAAEHHTQTFRRMAMNKGDFDGLRKIREHNVEEIDKMEFQMEGMNRSVYNLSQPKMKLYNNRIKTMRANMKILDEILI